MQPNTTYYQTDLQTPIVTIPGSGIPPANWTNTIIPIVNGQNITYWTGQGSQTDAYASNNNTCSDWTVGSYAGGAYIGMQQEQGAGSISDATNGYWTYTYTNYGCAYNYQLLCVSQ